MTQFSWIFLSSEANKIIEKNQWNRTFMVKFHGSIIFKSAMWFCNWVMSCKPHGFISGGRFSMWSIPIITFTCMDTSMQTKQHLPPETSWSGNSMATSKSARCRSFQVRLLRVMMRDSDRGASLSVPRVAASPITGSWAACMFHTSITMFGVT